MPRAKAALTALILAVGLTGAPRADEPHDRLALDVCYNYWYVGDYELRCDVYVWDVGGSTFVAGAGFGPALSPDGTWLAFNDFAYGYVTENIIVFNLETGARAIVPDAGGPAWSSDGRVAFHRLSNGARELFVMNADGSGVRQVTNGVGFGGHRPSWAVDGRIAFACDGAGGGDICSIRDDGTQFTRLTNSENLDFQPAFSPDGMRIAFVRDGALAILNSDGTVTALGLSGGAPAWSPDGSRLAFHVEESACPADGRICYGQTYVTTIDVPAATLLASGMNPSWGSAVGNVDFPTPVASITVSCEGLLCWFGAQNSFDPDGISNYQWAFGDGTGGNGISASHLYAPGTYTVTLTVTDPTGATASTSAQVSPVNNPPLVSPIQFSCDSLSCSFSGSASDWDGTLAGFAWNFGDGSEASSVQVTHVFPATGTYSVVLTVTDNYGATGSAVATVTVWQRFTHIGDLSSGRASHKKNWEAVAAVTVHETSHERTAFAFVTGVWSTGIAGTCQTDNFGICIVTLTGIPNATPSVTFTVSNVTSGAAMYNAAANHDVGGDTNGTSITITRPRVHP